MYPVKDVIAARNFIGQRKYIQTVLSNSANCQIIGIQFGTNGVLHVDIISTE